MGVAESNGDQELQAFATRLRELREKVGLSQESLAHAVGLTRDGYRVYEHAVRYPKSDVAVRLAATLGVSLDRLLLGPYLSVLKERDPPTELVAASP